MDTTERLSVFQVGSKAVIPLVPLIQHGIWSLAREIRASQVMPVVKNLPAIAGQGGDEGSVPGSGRSPGGGHGNPLQDSCLEDSMERGAWQATVHGVAKSQTQLKRLNTHAE